MCDLIEKSENSDWFRIVRNSISNERLNRWLSHSSGWLHHMAISKLGERMPAQLRMALLNALDDPDENVVREAKRILSRPEAETGSWYFADLHELTTKQRISIAEAFCYYRTDLSRHKTEFFRVMQHENDLDLLERLVEAICWFKEKTHGDLDMLISIQDRFSVSSWKIQLICTIRRLHGHGFDDRLITKLSQLLDDPDEWVRAEAVEKIGYFKTNHESVEKILLCAPI